MYEGSAAEVTVNVREESVLNAELVQTGYVVSIESPVDAMAVLANGAVTKEVELKKGTSRFCMSGKHYRLTPRACFECAEKEMTLSAERTSVVLVPSTYTIEGTIETSSTAGATVVNSSVVTCRYLSPLSRTTRSLPRPPRFFAIPTTCTLL